MSEQTVKLRVSGDASGAKSFADDAKAQVSGIGDAAQKSASTINSTFSQAQSRMDAFAKSGGGVSKAFSDQQGELAKLLGKIDPVVSAYDRLDKQYESLKRFKASGAISGEDFAVYAQKIDGARNALDKGSAATHGFNLNTASARLELGRLFKDLATGQTGRFEQTFTTLAVQSGALSSVLTATGIGVLGFVAIVGGLFLAYERGAAEQAAFEHALIATGNAAGTSAGQLFNQASQIGAATGQYGKAQAALTQLAASGKLSDDALGDAARGAVSLSELTGESIEKAVGEFEKLADDPVKAVVKLNESYHFLTGSIYDNIKALQDEGRQEDATALAIKTLADTMDDRRQQMVDSAGSIEKAWIKVKGAISEAIDNFKQVGRSDLQGQLQAAYAEQENNAEQRQINHGGGVLGFLGDVTGATARHDQEAADIAAKIASLQKLAATQGQTDLDAAKQTHLHDNEVAASIAIDAATLSLDKQAQKAKALQELNQNFGKLFAGPSAGTDPRLQGVQQLDGGGFSGGQYDTLRADINDKYSDHGKGARGAKNADREAANDALALVNAEKALSDIVERLGGGLNATAKAQADFNIGMSDLEQKANAAAIAGGDVTAIIAKWQQGEESLRANLERTNASIAARGKLASGNAALAAQLQQQKEKTSGLTAATIAYDQAVAQTALDVRADAAAGHDQATIAAELATRLTELQKIRDDAPKNSLIDQFGKKSEWEELQANIKSTGEEIAKASASGSKDLEALQRIQEKLKTTESQRNDELLGNGISSLQQFAKEGTAAYTALGIAQDILAYRAAVTAIATQGGGDPWTAFARIAAMIALMASIGIRVSGGGGGGPSSQSSEVRQAEQGTGSVLGDSTAKSESIANAVEITAHASEQLVGINRGMLTALLAVQAGLGAAGGQLARGANDVPFIGAQTPATNIGDPFGKDRVGNFLGSFLFGGSQKVIDEGITIAGGQLSEMLNSIVVGAYQTIQTDGGLFGSDSTSRQTIDISEGFAKQFQLVIKSIADTVREGAIALGLLPADVEAAIASYKVAAIDISLKGLSAEDQQKELEAVFSKIFDGLAGAVAPFIGQFQKVGEGLGETLVRVATEVQVVQEGFKQLGLSVDEADPEKFAQISDALIEAAGGLDSFISGMTSFAANFAPAEQQFQVASDALTSAFDQVGLAVPATRDGMWELMQSLDATTEAGRAQIATLLRLSDTADKYYDALEKRANDLVQGQVDYAQLLADVGSEGAGVSSVSPFAAARLQIEKWEQDTIKQANALAKAAGLQGASEKDLTLIHEVAAHRIASAIIALEESTADLVDQFYDRGKYASDAATDASSAVTSFGDAMTSAAQAAQAAAQLLLGELSPLNDQQKLQYALGAYQDGLINKEDVLQIGRRLYASSQKYDDLFQLLQTLPGGVQQSDGGGQGAAAAATAADYQHQETEAERDRRRHAEAEQISQNIVSLAGAEDKSYQDIADTLDISLGDLSEALGLSQDELIKYFDNLKAQESAVPDTIADGTARIVAALYDIAGRAPPPGDAHSGSGPIIETGHSTHELPGSGATTAPPPERGPRGGDSSGNAPVIERLDRLIIVNDRGHARTAAATTDTATAVRDVDRSIQRGPGPSTDMRRSNPRNGWEPQ